MQMVKETGQKEVKILKCERCGSEYVFDSVSQHCPKCRGNLRGKIVKLREIT